MSAVNGYRLLIAGGAVLATVTGVLMKQGTTSLGLFLSWGVLFAVGMGAVSIGVKRERAARSGQGNGPASTGSGQRLAPKQVLALAAAFGLLGGAILLWQLTGGQDTGAAAARYPQEATSQPVQEAPPAPPVSVDAAPTDAFPSGADAAAQAAADLDAFLGSLYATDTAGLLQGVVEVWVHNGYVTPDPEVRQVFEDRYAEIYRDGGAETGLPDTFLGAVDYFAN